MEDQALGLTNCLTSKLEAALHAWQGLAEPHPLELRHLLLGGVCLRP